MDYPTLRALIIAALILIPVGCAFIGWACVKVGARADRMSERIVQALIERKRLDEMAERMEGK